MLGFPIRTPPDHSLVANSPGLIAGSNVLHRLLMPRHPPCALHSLSQQRQDNTQKTHQPTPQSKEQASTQNDTTSQGIADHAFATTSTTTLPAPTTRTSPTASTTERADRSATRCSRPLCRSQTTTPPTPPTPTEATPEGTTTAHRHERQREDQKQPTPPPPEGRGTPTRKRRLPHP